MTLQQLALFVAGGLAWDAIVQAAMMASKSEVKLFGFKFTHKINKTLAVTNLIIALLLLWYALT